jgi:cell division protein FtsB
LRRTGAGLKAAADELRQQVESQKAELERQQADRDKAIKEAAELRGRADTLQSQNDLLLAKLSGKEDKN